MRVALLQMQLVLQTAQPDMIVQTVTTIIHLKTLMLLGTPGRMPVPLFVTEIVVIQEVLLTIA